MKSSHTKQSGVNTSLRRWRRIGCADGILSVLSCSVAPSMVLVEESVVVDGI